MSNAAAPYGYGVVFEVLLILDSHRLINYAYSLIGGGNTCAYQSPRTPRFAQLTIPALSLIQNMFIVYGH